MKIVYYLEGDRAKEQIITKDHACMLGKIPSKKELMALKAAMFRTLAMSPVERETFNAEIDRRVKAAQMTPTP